MHTQKLLDNPDSWHGSELSVVIAGNWQYYRAKVLKYLQQIAVITPYAQVGGRGGGGSAFGGGEERTDANLWDVWDRGRDALGWLG